MIRCWRATSIAAYVLRASPRTSAWSDGKALKRTISRHSAPRFRGAGKRLRCALWLERGQVQRIARHLIHVLANTSTRFVDKGQDGRPISPLEPKLTVYLRANTRVSNANDGFFHMEGIVRLQGQGRDARRRVFCAERAKDRRLPRHGGGIEFDGCILLDARLFIGATDESNENQG